MPKVTTSTGVVLDTGAHWSMDLTRHARRKGFTDVIGAVATHPKGDQEYVLIQGNEVIFCNTSFEAAAVHIDIMALRRDFQCQDEE